MKQHVAVHTGAARGFLQSNTTNRSAVASLPAVNRPRPSKSATAEAKAQHSKDKTENQLQALSKYSSRLRNLDMPYELGVGVNRKGPSATANQKDKSDRATSEQVLDPRTRIILFKMIGRGLLFEVNGCVSTGKEVFRAGRGVVLLLRLCVLVGECVSCTHTRSKTPCFEDLQNLDSDIQGPRPICFWRVQVQKRI